MIFMPIRDCENQESESLIILSSSILDNTRKNVSYMNFQTHVTS